jgi:hypothetical protein
MTKIPRRSVVDAQAICAALLPPNLGTDWETGRGVQCSGTSLVRLSRAARTRLPFVLFAVGDGGDARQCAMMSRSKHDGMKCD